jgi:lipoprotein NlpI
LTLEYPAYPEGRFMRIALGMLERTSFVVVVTLLAAVTMLSRAPAAEPAPAPEQLFRDAVAALFAGRVDDSACLFDEVVAARPASEPHLWQRGIALYYAGRFADGRRQFELHRTVNPADVENVTWHFACVARETGLEAARAALLPVGDDARVPMREILALYAGSGDAAAVLAAAEAGPDALRRNHLCYAHLYLGMYAEARGDADEARRHIMLAAGPFAMDHFMGKVARLHARLRGWPPAADDAIPPE